MLKAVVNKRADGRFEATVVDESDKILWGPSVFQEQGKALETAKARMDEIQRRAGKLS